MGPDFGVFWIVGGIALLGLEAVLPRMLLICPGVAAVVTGLMTLLAAPALGVQVIAFAMLTAASIAAALRARGRGGVQPPAGLRGELVPVELVGQVAVALAFRGRDGRVRVGESDWPARLARGCEAVEPGWMLEVAGVSGTVVVVRTRGRGVSLTEGQGFALDPPKTGGIWKP